MRVSPVENDATETADTDATSIPDDSMITRNRRVRVQQFCGYCLLVVLNILFWAKIADDLIDYMPLGVWLGIILSALFVAITINRLIVSVDGFSVFITENPWRPKAPYVVYGPGDHFALFFEKRRSDRNIDLTADDEPFETPILTTSGLVNLIGSVLLQPDIRNIVTFYLKVAGLSVGLKNLLSAFLLDSLKGKSVQQVLDSVEEINTSLATKFVRGAPGSSRDPQVSKFERDFGVIASYFNIGQIRLSREAEETRTGLDEAEIIAQGTLKLLGYDSLAAARAANKTEADIRDARQSFMAATKNITMNRQVNEIVINVDEPIVAALAPFIPDLAAILRARQTQRPQGGN